MRESPILFSAPMVRAILDVRKTVTRRIIKPQPPAETPFYRGAIGTYSGAARPRHFWGRYPDRDAFQDARSDGEAEDILWPGGDSDGFTCDVYAAESGLACPYGASANCLLREGDRLWVREAWRVPASLDDLSGKGIAEKCLTAGYRAPWCPTQYEADGALSSEKDWRGFGPHPSTSVPGRYRHARFMPRWASRITLEVTGVRVERLQDISEEDARSEGVGAVPDFRYGLDHPQAMSYRAGFAQLWEQINGAGNWDANPWVWVVAFRQIDQEATACI